MLIERCKRSPASWSLGGSSRRASQTSKRRKPFSSLQHEVLKFCVHRRSVARLASCPEREKATGKSSSFALKGSRAKFFCFLFTSRFVCVLCFGPKSNAQRPIIPKASQLKQPKHTKDGRPAKTHFKMAKLFPPHTIHESRKFLLPPSSVVTLASCTDL